MVLEGNVEDKKPKLPIKGKTEKAAGEKKSAARKSDGGASSAAGSAEGADKAQPDSAVVPAEPLSFPSEWAGHGAIALVSHSALGGITVIHTEVSAGTQIQPIVTTDSTGASVISLDTSAIPLPFSIPVTMAHSIPLSSDASSTSLSGPTLSVLASDGTPASLSDTQILSSSSDVLEVAASQTILAPASESLATCETDLHTVIVSDMVVKKEQIVAIQVDGEQTVEDS